MSASEPVVAQITLADATALPIKEAPYEASAIRAVIDRLKRSLDGYKIDLESPPSPHEVDKGPRLLRAYVRLRAGQSIQGVRRVSEDIARDVGAAASDIHICNVPERHAIGLDIPVPGMEYSVTLEELQRHPSFDAAAREMDLGFCAGIDVTGRAKWVDLAKMPHMLVAGTTGSGKTVFLRSVLLTLLVQHTPKELQIILSSSKPMDFRPFTTTPHAQTLPMAESANEALELVDTLVKEMERRYEIISKAMVDDLGDYNAEHPEKPIPRIVAVLDEFSETVLSFEDKTTRKVFEGSVARLAQKARAAGIHLILCMQRPDSTVLQGPIKSNILHRFALKLPQKHDSGVILDESGAEALLGKGDLFYKDASSRLFRLQVPFLQKDTMRDVLQRLQK
ncbi:MAG: DNA translocase FtsK [Polyangia bacterium]|jgi:DNA segregation ATPase FtsK/SpoIIIE-like protein|nr:DNA translocase FtsK [Polyangia bacterium]